MGLKTSIPSMFLRALFKIHPGKFHCELLRHFTLHWKVKRKLKFKIKTYFYSLREYEKKDLKERNLPNCAVIMALTESQKL